MPYWWMLYGSGLPLRCSHGSLYCCHRPGIWTWWNVTCEYKKKCVLVSYSSMCHLIRDFILIKWLCLVLPTLLSWVPEKQSRYVKIKFLIAIKSLWQIWKVSGARRWYILPEPDWGFQWWICCFINRESSSVTVWQYAGQNSSANGYQN